MNLGKAFLFALLLAGCSSTDVHVFSATESDSGAIETGGAAAVSTGGARHGSGGHVAGAGGIRATGGAAPSETGGASSQSSGGAGSVFSVDSGPAKADAAPATDAGVSVAPDAAIPDSAAFDAAPEAARPCECSDGPCCDIGRCRFLPATQKCDYVLTATYCQNPAQGLGCRLPHDVWLSPYYLEEWSDVYCSGASSSCDGRRQAVITLERGCPGDTSCYGDTHPGGSPAHCAACN